MQATEKIVKLSQMLQLHKLHWEFYMTVVNKEFPMTPLELTRDLFFDENENWDAGIKVCEHNFQILMNMNVIKGSLIGKNDAIEKLHLNLIAEGI